jgi:hypothetical protein
MDQCTGPGPNSAPFVYFLYFLTTMIAILHGVQVFIQEGRPLEHTHIYDVEYPLSVSLSRYLSEKIQSKISKCVRTKRTVSEMSAFVCTKPQVNKEKWIETRGCRASGPCFGCHGRQT